MDQPAKQNLGVGLRLEPASIPRDELWPQPVVIVNFAVEEQQVATVFLQHRLVGTAVIIYDR